MTLNVAGDLPSRRPCSSDVRVAHPVLTMGNRGCIRAWRATPANFKILANKAGYCFPVLVLNSQHHQKNTAKPLQSYLVQTLIFAIRRPRPGVFMAHAQRHQLIKDGGSPACFLPTRQGTWHLMFPFPESGFRGSNPGKLNIKFFNQLNRWVSLCSMGHAI